MRTRIAAAAAVATLSIVLPGAASGVRPMRVSDVPAVAVPITIEVHKERPVAAAEKTEPSTPTRSLAVQAKAQTVTAAKAIPAPPKPSELVREWHVMYAQSTSSDDPSDTEPCPHASTCDSYQLRPARWPTDSEGRASIPFAYNDDGRRRARAPDGILGPALVAGMNEWSRWNSNIVFRNNGTTPASFGADGEDGSCDDGTNVVTWEKFDRDVIGAAVICFDKSGRVIRDADLALNATQHWERVSGTPDSRHSHDVQSILTHELGHWLALEDLYSGNDARQTMFGNTAYGETRKRTLALGDVLGVQKAYPCDSGDRCPRSGMSND
jgi:hypothetical protein